MAGRNKWSRVSILTALLKEVDTLIRSNPQLGYPSASSFVNDAVRRQLERYRDRTEENEVRSPITTNASLKTFLKELVLATARELQAEVDPKSLNKIITAVIQKLNQQ